MWFLNNSSGTSEDAVIPGEGTNEGDGKQEPEGEKNLFKIIPSALQLSNMHSCLKERKSLAYWFHSFVLCSSSGKRICGIKEISISSMVSHTDFGEVKLYVLSCVLGVGLEGRAPGGSYLGGRAEWEACHPWGDPQAMVFISHEILASRWTSETVPPILLAHFYL